MGVTPIGYPSLTQADVRAIRARGSQLVDRGLFGGCIPVETEDGDLVVAILSEWSSGPSSCRLTFAPPGRSSARSRDSGAREPSRWSR